MNSEVAYLTRNETRMGGHLTINKNVGQRCLPREYFPRHNRQSRTQSPRAFWSADERPERLWDNGLELFLCLVACITMAVRQEVGK